MGTMELLLFLLLGHYIAAQTVIKMQDDTFLRDIPFFFNGIMPFPFDRKFDFPPPDTIFSSWRTWSPDFHMLADLPPIPIIPRVEVFCDESELTVLVHKSSNGLTLTGEEVQLGDGCYSNRELPNQFVFTYSLDECGTTPVMQNGLVMFTNSLHLNLRMPPTTWWQTRLTVHISCVPKRPYPNFFASTPLPENSKTLNIKAMNSSWTGTADSNIYERGQVVNLQVSAKTRPEQQLFIQSCFVSASPEPDTRPRHAVIMNKGCAARLGSPHAVVHFVASDRADVVNFILDTSHLISELYIHCSVLISDQGVNVGSKSCNYNMIQSRWEDLNGNLEVCKCCTSKCKGLSLKHLPEGVKAIVSTSPLVVVDKPIEARPSEAQEASSAPVADPMQSQRAATEDTLVYGNAALRPTQVVSQEQDATPALWLPGQVQDTEHGENIGSESKDNLTIMLQASDAMSNELQPSTTDQEPLLNTPTNMVIDQNANELGSDGHKWDLNDLTLVDGWAIPQQTEKAAFAEESQRKKRFDRSGLSDAEVPQDVDFPLTADMNANVNLNDCNSMREELAAMPQEEANAPQPIVRSKLQFAKGTDGSQTLSYEEEVLRQQEVKGVTRRFWLDGIKRKAEPRQRGLQSIFLDLLRRMDKAE